MFPLARVIAEFIAIIALVFLFGKLLSWLLQFLRAN